MIEAARIETPFVTLKTVEQAFRYSKIWHREDKRTFAQIGMRAARAQDPKLIAALGKAFEILEKESEARWGEHQRKESTSFQEKATLQEVAFFRELFVTAKEGRPVSELEWGYAAGAWLAGFI